MTAKELSEKIRALTLEWSALDPNNESILRNTLETAIDYLNIACSLLDRYEYIKARMRNE